MCEVFRCHQVSPGFLDVLCRFGDRQVSSDEGVGSVICNSPDSSSRGTLLPNPPSILLANSLDKDIFYQLRYPERNGRKHGDPWSLRQTGVYHRYSMPASGIGQNFCLLLHPMQDSKAQKRISSAAASGMTATTIGLDPLRLHVMIISSYVHNWCWYLRYNTKNYLELVSNIERSLLLGRSNPMSI
jgi:hypothetical protein